MRTLVVDDEKNIRRTMAMALESMDHDVVSVGSGAEALKELRGASYDVVFLDLKLQQENGLDFLEEILRVAPQAAIVIVTAFASIETAVEAMRRGAFDYLPKPCTPDQVRQLLARIERTRRLENRVVELESQISAESPDIDLTTESPKMEAVLNVAFKAANSEATVLLLGESGTGKTILARGMHARSPRKACAFVTVSCPSLSRDLLESDLFGHVKGAFTGALVETQGKVAAADGGTLFLDEIGDIPLALQPKLLRVLQEQKFERLGCGQTHHVDVRLVAATHRNLEEMIKHNQFRSDLYYRLNVFPITLPPLRERRDDIVPLVMHYVELFARRMRKTIEHIPDETLAAFKCYPWPGNVRELQNVVERAVILSKDGSLPNPLPPTSSDVSSENPGFTTLRASERSLILHTLDAVNWVIGGAGGAAAKLGIPRTTLISKMRKLRISRPAPRFPKQQKKRG